VYKKQAWVKLPHVVVRQDKKESNFGFLRKGIAQISRTLALLVSVSSLKVIFINKDW